MGSTTLRASLLALALLLLSGTLPAQQQVLQTTEPGLTPKQRELYFYGMRAYPFGRIPQNARLEALYQSDSKVPRFGHDGQSMLSANQWQMIGPSNIGGRINSIACHPTDGKTVYIGAADGGVWKSTDRGESWSPIMDFENAISMGAIAIDPRNPNTVYAGSGEMSSNIDAYNGAGLFKSVNGGSTWRPIGLTNVGAFSKVVVHPANSNLIFAGATKNNSGLYRSEDGGNTWSRTFTDAVSDVTVNPSNQNQLWIATMSKGVYRSDDGGKTWVEKNVDLGQIGNTKGRTSVQCAPSNPSVLYALIHETNGTGTTATNFARIYKSTNSGDTWVTVYSGQDFLNLGSSTQGWYNNVLVVKPNDPNTCVAAGISIVRTTDGGNNWYYINSYGGGNAPHPDHHALAIDPANTDVIYLGNDGGMYRSDDNGTTYAKKSSGLAITQFYAMAVDQSKPATTYGGTQDNGTVSSASNFAGNVLGGDGFYVCVDYTNPNLIYAENPNGDLRRIDLNGSTVSIMNGINPNDSASWSAPLVMDPSTPSTLWHGRHTIYATFDQGNSWVASNLTLQGQSSAIGISPVNTSVIYAGSDRGEIFVSQDGGDHWDDRTTAPGSPNRAITDFAPSRTKAGTVYMTVSGFYSGHVFKSADFGETWTDISGELPDIPMNAIALHPDDENIIYVGSDIGMFISTDGGKSWSSYNQGLPRVAVADLEVHKSSGKLRMASHGRSMWEIALEKPDLPPSILSPQGGEVWMAGTQHAISWSNITGAVKIEVSLDDGGHWYPLIDNVTSFRWNVFDTSSVQARVRVTSTTDAGKTATSNSFTITKFSVGGLVRAAQVTSVPYGLAYDGQYLWASDFAGSKLLQLDPNTLATVGRVQLDASMGDSLFTDMAFNPKNGHLFMHKLNNTTDASPGGLLFEVDKNGHQVGRWTSRASYPIGLVYLPNPAGDQLLVTDRNGSQNMFLLDASNPATLIQQLQRSNRVQYGPRGATLGPDGKTIYQVITDFTGEALQTAVANKFTLPDQQNECQISLTSPILSGYINARGLELDPRDSNLWVSDYSGNIYKIISCDSHNSAGPPPQLGVAGATVPEGMALEQNTPNPFMTTTRIAFTLPTAMHVRLAVFDAAGRTVNALADERYDAGTHAVEFDPAGLASGAYRCVLTTDGGATLSRTMIYVK
ncbi:MAG TPA: hypothetical protein VHI13_19770 [Candidatus Kapabacteria bacterium]|nr:hypothetical protein [Candidatus Kapabacteria bacterium]